MKKKHILSIILAASALGSAAVLAQGQGGGQPPAPPQPLGFFITSEGHTGNLGGLAGADAACQRLAATVGAGNRTWRAYLSTQAANGQPAANARDRIGNGPWYNAHNELIAANVADLHGDNARDRNNIYKGSALDEKGNMVPGRGDQPQNEHDMLTGSDSFGRALPAGEDRTCRNWTSDSPMDHAMLGHHDRNGGGTTSWNSAHVSAGCDAASLKRTGGAGHFYCFAAN